MTGPVGPVRHGDHMTEPHIVAAVASSPSHTAPTLQAPLTLGMLLDLANLIENRATFPIADVIREYVNRITGGAS